MTVSRNGNNGRMVSVVIPTLDNPRMLSQALESIRGQSYPAHLVEIVVADNLGTPNTAALLRTRFPTVMRVDLGKNVGFAMACNRGASEASGEYIAFLNDDAVAAPDWLEALFAALEAGGAGAVCAASHIRSRDGREVEYSGASANLFGVGRPRPVWGWPDSRETPIEGSPVLFASGGAMLVHRQTFLDAGSFDPHFFAYFEDVDLGWRLWLLGHRVVYAPRAVVRHLGGATGSKSGAHRRYTLWECNALATVLKNYEAGHMEKIVPAALLLLYKRALLSAGEAFDPQDYRLTGRRDTNAANVEQLPKVSVAHIAAIDRFNALLPAFMEERRRLLARRVRPDSEILPLLGRAYELQYSGSEYASVARELATTMQLYGITEVAAPNRVLIVASSEDEAGGRKLATKLSASFLVAVAVVGGGQPGAVDSGTEYSAHHLAQHSGELVGLLEQADAVLAFTSAPEAIAGHVSGTPVMVLSAGEAESGINRIVAFCSAPVPLSVSRR